MVFVINVRFAFRLNFLVNVGVISVKRDAYWDRFYEIFRDKDIGIIGVLYLVNALSWWFYIRFLVVLLVMFVNRYFASSLALIRGDVIILLLLIDRDGKRLTYF